MRRKDKYIMLTITLSFIIAFTFIILGAILYPPDLNNKFPIYSSSFVMLAQAAGAFLLIGLTVIAMKAEEEKQILAAAGFTAQAISYGIGIMSLFDIIDVTTFEQYEKYYRVTVSGNFLIIPSVILIATYKYFKKWIRYLTILAVLPLIISSSMFLIGMRDYFLLENIANLGVATISMSWLFWAFNIYKNHINQIKN